MNYDFQERLAFSQGARCATHPTLAMKNSNELEIDMLIRPDQRHDFRPIGRDRLEYENSRDAIAPPKPDFDEIDELVDIPGPVQMRKQSEVSRLLSILDELETGKDGRH